MKPFFFTFLVCLVSTASATKSPPADDWKIETSAHKLDSLHAVVTATCVEQNAESSTIDLIRKVPSIFSYAFLQLAIWYAGSGAKLAPGDVDNDGVPDITDLDSDNDGIPDSEECASVSVDESLSFSQSDIYEGAPPGPGTPAFVRNGVDGISNYTDGYSDATRLNFAGWDRPGSTSVDWSEGQYVLTSNERSAEETPAMVLQSPVGGGFAIFSTSGEAISKDLTVVIGQEYSVELWLGILPAYYENNKDNDGTPGIDPNAGTIFNYGGRIEIGAVAGAAVAPGYTSMGDQIDAAGNPSLTDPYYSYDILEDFPVTYTSADFPPNLPAYDPSEVYATYPTLDPHWTKISIQFVATASVATIQLKTNNGNWSVFTVDDLDITYSISGCDTDNDGVENYLDLDSDNDGIYDLVEAGHTALDANNDGIIDGAPAAFGTNGLFDGIETFAESAVINYTLANSESTPDEFIDAYEIDADDDGCPDVLEAGYADDDSDGELGNSSVTVDANGLVTSGSGGYTGTSNNVTDHTTQSGCADNDNDNVSDGNDDDDDNDGITDYTELGCNSSFLAFNVTWTQSNAANDAVQINRPAIIASAQPLTFGSGHTGVRATRRVDIPTINSGTLAEAISSEEFIQYEFTTQAAINAVLLGDMSHNKNPDFSGATAETYSYSIGLAISDDNFVTRTMISYGYFIDGNIPTGYEHDFMGNDDEDFQFEPSTTYTVRVYFFDKKTSGSARFDDFAILSYTCENLLDQDGDLVYNHKDLDSDGDLCNDVSEAGFTDGDSDGILGTSPVTVNARGRVSPRVDGYSLPIETNSGFDDFLDSSVNSACPEICNNGIDDDNDGLIDCLDCSDCTGDDSCPDTDNDGVNNLCDLDSDNDGIPDEIECAGITVKPTQGFNFEDIFTGPSPGPGSPVVTKVGVDGVSRYADGSNGATLLNFLGWDRPNNLSVDWSEGQYVLTSNERSAEETPAMILQSPVGGGFAIFSTDEEAISKDFSVTVGEEYNIELWLGILPHYYDNNRDTDGTPGIDPNAGILFSYNGRIEIGAVAGAAVAPGYTSSGLQIDPSGNSSSTHPYYSYNIATDFPVNYSQADFPPNLPAYDPSEVYSTYPTLDPHWMRISIVFVATATTATVQLKTNNGNLSVFTVDDLQLNQAIVGCDSDGDGVPNFLDLDSDNDGIYDALEAGHGAQDLDNNGVVDGAPSAFGTNGLHNSLETNVDDGILNYHISDSESRPDGNIDAVEIDSDGDGCFDTLEEAISDTDEDGTAGSGLPTISPSGLITSITYTVPTENRWQDPTVRYCGPEICNNGVDDDGDGNSDCADDDCPCYNPFVCESKVFMAYSTNTSQPSTFSSLNTSNSPFTFDVTGSVGFNVNALGYRDQDNFIYGIELLTTNLIRIDAGGVGYDLGPITGLPAPSGFTGVFDAGDVFPDGFFYVQVTGSDNKVYQIDVSSTPPQLIATHTLDRSIHLSDFAYNSVDSKLYGVADNGRKYMIDPVSWTTTIVGTNASAASYGAAYTDNLGRVFVYNNNEGAIYRVEFGINGTGSGAMHKVADAPQVYFNDGASCRGTILIPEICDNGNDDDGDGLIDCEDDDCPNAAPVVRINRL